MVPFDVPPGYKVTKITDRNAFNAATGNSFPTCGNFDMVALAATEGAAKSQYPNAFDFIFVSA